MIARYNHFARSDYSKSVKLKYCCLAFCQCYRGSDECAKENSILKSTQYAIKVVVTFFKRKI